jgi:RHS repeat-associated protein
MGCLKLTYQNNSKHLKVVYSNAFALENNAQRFLSVDPLAAKAPGWTPYRFCFDNPINFIDPDGRFETRKEARAYKKEHGIEGRIRKDSDGEGFNVSNKYTGQSWSKGSQWEIDNGYAGKDGIVESAFVVGDKASSTANFEYAKNVLDMGGGVYGALQSATVTGDSWLGKNGQYYNSSWGGNQHTGSGSGAYSAASRYKWAGRGTVIATGVIGGVEIYNGINQDGGKFGYHAQRATGSASGGIVGGLAGANYGASLGGIIGGAFGGVGAIPGAIIGGFLGGWLGGEAGSSIGEKSVDYYHGK